MFLAKSSEPGTERRSLWVGELAETAETRTNEIREADFRKAQGRMLLPEEMTRRVSDSGFDMKSHLPYFHPDRSAVHFGRGEDVA